MNRPILHYLAGPFSTPDDELRHYRKYAHARCAVALKRAGYAVYAPIAETTALAEYGGITGTSWEDWREHDLNLLIRCDKILVMLIPGWKESLGVKGEVKFALKNNIPIEFVDEAATKFVITDVLAMFEVNHVEDLND
jgi:hypothetical protein